jgi:hypothetical protein
MHHGGWKCTPLVRELVRDMKPHRSNRARHLRFEPLEARQMLAARLPDLAPLADAERGFLHDVYFEAREGREWIRFTSAIANFGGGPLDVYWGPPAASGTQPAYQRVYDTNGGHNDYLVGNFEYHPTHNHTHMADVAQYSLRTRTPGGGVGQVVASGEKTSFCLEDSRLINGALPGAPASGVYDCSNQGISVGWADVYGHYLDGQFIDVSSLPSGDYWLETIVDPDNRLRESSDANNTVRVAVHWDTAANRIRVAGPPPAIAPDLYEDNDSRAIVDSHRAGVPGSPSLGVVTSRRTLSALTLEDAADWYAFEPNTAPGSSHSVRIDYEHDQGDLDLRLYNAAGQLIATSDGTTDREQLSLSGLSEAKYYVEVFGALGATNASYSLTLDLPPAQGGIAPDAYEHNDSLASVALRTPGDVNSANLGRVSGWRTIHGLTMEDGFDWFRFQLDSAGRDGDFVRIDLEHDDGDLDMRLYDSTGAALETSESESDVETISLSGRAAGVYYLEVYGWRGATNPAYKLTMAAPPSQGHPADASNVLVTGTDAGEPAVVRVYDRTTGQPRGQFSPYGSFAGGVRVATADVSGDGVIDIITGAGPGGGPHVRVFDGATGQQLGGAIGSFFAYASAFTGGVFVAAADFNNDGHADIVTSAGAGGGPHVRVFSGRDGSELGGFFAYAAAFSGGAQVATGDIDGDGAAEIITGAGPGGGPHVRVFDTPSGAQMAGPVGSFFAYDPRFTGGVYVAAGDIDGDNRADIITGAGAGGGPHVRAFSGGDLRVLANFFAYAANFSGGVRVAAGDANADGRADLFTAAGPGGGPHVRVFDGVSHLEHYGMYSGSPTSTAGLFLAGGPSVRGGVSAILSAELPVEFAATVETMRVVEEQYQRALGVVLSELESPGRHSKFWLDAEQAI